MELLILQKAIVKLLQPVGLIWVVLLFIAIRASCKREIGTARLLTCLWLSCSLAANPIVSDVLVGTLENRFCHIHPLQMESLDILVVLGGGTTSTEGGDPALADGGDRVGLAARMYHAGKVDKIIVSGKQIASLSTGIAGDPATQAATLLVQLGVSSDHISMLGGRNTLEEMLALKEILSGEHGREVAVKGGQRPRPAPLANGSAVAARKVASKEAASSIVPNKVGLITSAWHLPRALRLARKAGLKLQPVPADFASTPRNRSILDLIPDHNALRNTARTMKEYLGMAVGR